MIQIFGERSSGTTYLERLIEENYPDESLTSEYGFKHCFQKEGLEKPIDDKCNFVVIYRNPYDWLRSLHKFPHHAPEMLYVSFSSFLRNSWRTYKGKEWLSKIPDERTSIMKPENLREEYRNVLELRVRKIELFESFRNKTDRIVYLRYEDLRDNPEESMNHLAEVFGLGACKNLKNISLYKRTKKKYRRTRYLRIRKKDLDYINTHLDWDLENRIGYLKKNKCGSISDHIIYKIQYAVRRSYHYIYRQVFSIKRVLLRK